jgi:hypothetical protein
MPVKKDNVIAFKTAYRGYEPQQFETDGDSLTQQHFQDECDIHNIISRHDRAGLIANVNRGVAQYGDFSEVTDYGTALRTIRQAEQNFLQLPSDLRRQFNNNPGEFYQFASDPSNLDELVEMGLAEKVVESSAGLPMAEKSPSHDVDPAIDQTAGEGDRTVTT